MPRNDNGKKNIFNRFKGVFLTDTTFHETEVQANRLGTVVMMVSGIILGIILILNVSGIFKTDMRVVSGPLIQGIIEAATVVFICFFFRFDKWWLKWVLVIAMTMVYARLDGIFTHKAWILMVIPVIFSARYFSRKLTIFTTVITSVLFFISALWGSVYGLFDLNIVTLPAGMQMVSGGGYLDQAVLDTGFDRGSLLWDVFIYNYIPKWMLFFIAALISMNISRRGRDMVLRQHKRDLDDARIESELELAGRIQEDMLETDFTGFCMDKPIEIFASMTPAKEVGGDFYDFFMIDETHLGLVMADVSGKGIPAALMMTKTMTLIRSGAVSGRLPEYVLDDVNAKLCDKNEEEMFVTAWLGILDISTGLLRAASAGHEYPFLKRSGDTFCLLKYKHGFVLGGLEKVSYTGYDIQMEPGDCIFLYTDGLTEAESGSDGFFGAGRILENLNKKSTGAPEDIIHSMSGAVDEFTKDNLPFDDLTMMCLKYTGHDDKDLVMTATIENIHIITDYVNKSPELTGCSDKIKDQISIAVDEIVSNIAKYAYTPDTGDVKVNVYKDDKKNMVCITFTDSGKRFDPLEQADPDISLSAGNRDPGGLGIYMVKKLMDDVRYEYKDGQNNLKIYKCI